MIGEKLLAAMREQGDVWCMDLSAISRFVADGERKVTPRIPRVAGNVAVIPLQGVITKRGTWFSDGTDAVARTLRAAKASKSIGGIVLDIDSPGGSTYGLTEFADEVYSMRGDKPIIAVANPLAASAAYWSGTAADQLIVTPSGDVGSVGVWSMHVNQAEFLKQIGVEVTLISAGKFKVEGHPFAPLSDEARAEMQRSVDESYDQFISTVARNRGVNKSKVLSDFGQGRVLSAERALSAGMVDRVASLEDVLAKMGVTPETGPRSRASVEVEEMLCKAWSGLENALVEAREFMEARQLRRRRERSRS